ncbi:MAG: hypothetical protein HRF40_01155 [Nitrososphaera sp.]|jgi:hypothetical protein
MELIESAMWVALGFGPTMAALLGASKARLLLLRTTKTAGDRGKEDILRVR